MPDPPNLCVVVPVYNHARTVAKVVASALQSFPVIAVNDGSTDQTAAALATVPVAACVTLPGNRGKGDALLAGFARARALGHTHAITVDADGQHPSQALPVLAAACREHPDAIILGVRNLRAAGAPWPRRVSNRLSAFWFRFETGLALADTQTGLRCYPLHVLGGLRIRSHRYAWELEALVRTVWAGGSLVTRSVDVDYRSPTSQLSHFKPVSDFLHIAFLHARLACQAACLPAPLRKISSRANWDLTPRRIRIRTALQSLVFRRSPDSEAADQG